jgi:glycolate oxidase
VTDPALRVGAAVADGGADGLDQAMRAAVHDALLAVRAVLPDGPPVRFGSNAVKDVAGYDLKRLYTGGGRAFGAVSEVTFRLTPAR